MLILKQVGKLSNRTRQIIHNILCNLLLMWMYLVLKMFRYFWKTRQDIKYQNVVCMTQNISATYKMSAFHWNKWKNIKPSGICKQMGHISSITILLILKQSSIFLIIENLTNILLNIVTGKYVYCMLFFIKRTPFVWYCVVIKGSL